MNDDTRKLLKVFGVALTQRDYAIQIRLQTHLSEVAAKWSGTPSP